MQAHFSFCSYYDIVLIILSHYQILKIQMMRHKIEDDPDEPDFSVLSLNGRSSSVQADGSLIVSGPRKRSIFRRNKSTKVVLVGDSRVPFMALYQVRISAHRFVLQHHRRFRIVINFLYTCSIQRQTLMTSPFTSLVSMT